MTVELIKHTLAWSSVINIGILIFIFLMYVFARDFAHRTHSYFFKLEAKEFDLTYYRVMAYYKIAVILFNIVPYLALRIAT